MPEREGLKPLEIARNFYYKINYHIKEATLTDAQAEVIMDEFIKNYRPSTNLEPLDEEAVKDFLMQYKCKYTVTDEGDGLPLVDQLTPADDSTIKFGLMEIDHMTEEICSKFTAPEAKQGLSVEYIKDIFNKEKIRQGEFGMEPSLEDYAIAIHQAMSGGEKKP